MKRKKEMTKRGNNHKAGSNAEINKLKKITVMSMNYMNIENTNHGRLNFSSLGKQ
jgi:hypothetical protein